MFVCEQGSWSTVTLLCREKVSFYYVIRKPALSLFRRTVVLASGWIEADRSRQRAPTAWCVVVHEDLREQSSQSVWRKPGANGRHSELPTVGRQETPQA